MLLRERPHHRLSSGNIEYGSVDQAQTTQHELRPFTKPHGVDLNATNHSSTSPLLDLTACQDEKIQQGQQYCNDNTSSVCPQQLQNTKPAAVTQAPESSQSTPTPSMTRESTPAPVSDSNGGDDDDDNDDARLQFTSLPTARKDHRGLYYGSYNVLVFTCLLLAPAYQMVLKDIYDWFSRFTVKRFIKTCAMKASVRYNLSKNKAFAMGPRSNAQKGAIWHLVDKAFDEGIKPTRRGPNKTTINFDDSSDDSDFSSRPRKTSVKRKEMRKRLKTRAQARRAILENQSCRGDSAAVDDFDRSPSPSPAPTSGSEYGSMFDNSLDLESRAQTPATPCTPGPYYLPSHSSHIQPFGAASVHLAKRAVKDSPYTSAAQRPLLPTRARSSTPANGALQPFLRRQASTILLQHRSPSPLCLHAMNQADAFSQESVTSMSPYFADDYDQGMILSDNSNLNQHISDGSDDSIFEQHVSDASDFTIDPYLSSVPSAFATSFDHTLDAEYLVVPSAHAYDAQPSTFHSLDYALEYHQVGSPSMTIPGFCDTTTYAPCLGETAGLFDFEYGQQGDVVMSDGYAQPGHVADDEDFTNLASQFLHIE